MEEGGAGVDGVDGADNFDAAEQALGRLTSAEMLPDAAIFQPPPAVLRASESGRLPRQSAEVARRLSDGLFADAEEEIERVRRRLSIP